MNTIAFRGAVALMLVGISTAQADVFTSTSEAYKLKTQTIAFAGPVIAQANSNTPAEVVYQIADLCFIMPTFNGDFGARPRAGLLLTDAKQEWKIAIFTPADETIDLRVYPVSLQACSK